MRDPRLRLVAAAVTVFALAGCAAQERPVGALPSASVDPVRVVVIGDSLVNPLDVCEGCTGFLDQYGSGLAQLLGRPSETDVVVATGVPDAVAAVSGDRVARAKIAAADVVIVQVGYNNALPDPETGIGCGGSLEAGIMPWIRTTMPDCLSQGVATYSTLYDQVLTGVKEVRAGLPTLYILTNTINGNIDPSTPGLVGEIAERDRPDAREWAVEAYDRWNTMLGQRAATAGFAYVDLYSAFNGPDGTRPLGELSSDGAHPSQQGHDLIAAKLAEVDVSTLKSR